MPQSRYRSARDLPLNGRGAGPFCRFSIARGLNVPGVYVLTLAGEVVYVGKCTSLAQRFGPQGYRAIQPKNCFVGGQSTNCKINNLALQHAKAEEALELWFHAIGATGPVERDLIVRSDRLGTHRSRGRQSPLTALADNAVAQTAGTRVLAAATHRGR